MCVFNVFVSFGNFDTTNLIVIRTLDNSKFFEGPIELSRINCKIKKEFFLNINFLITSKPSLLSTKTPTCYLIKCFQYREILLSVSIVTPVFDGIRWFFVVFTNR